jgi:probable HAF family extracellular repeat protein
VDAFSGGELNDRGQVAAQIDVGVNNPSAIEIRSSFWSNGHATDLGTLGGQETFEAALNDKGVVVGASELSATVEHGFVWQSGKITDIGTLPGDQWSSLGDINNSGVAIGDSGSGAQAANNIVDHPVIWSDGKLTDVDTLIPANSGWTIESLTDINDSDQIVGLGSYDGQERAFLLTPNSLTADTVNQIAAPIPEPSLLLLASLPLLQSLRRRRRAT